MKHTNLSKRFFSSKLFAVAFAVSVSSFFLSSNVFAALTSDFLLNALRSYITVPQTTTTSSTPTTGTSNVSSLTQAQLISALRNLLANGLPSDIAFRLRGPQGLPGPQGPAGTTGSSGGSSSSGNYVTQRQFDSQVDATTRNISDLTRSITRDISEEVNTDELTAIAGDFDHLLVNQDDAVYDSSPVGALTIRTERGDFPFGWASNLELVDSGASSIWLHNTDDDKGMIVGQYADTLFFQSTSDGDFDGSIMSLDGEHLGVAIGENFSYPQVNAPTNGLIVEGNVGIGTDNPSAALEVNGDIKITAGSGGTLYFSDGTGMTSAAATSTGFTSSTDLNFAADSDANGSGVLILSTAGEERLRIDNDGNVGIGTSDPQFKLDVDGTIHFGPDESTLPALLQGYTGATTMLVTSDVGSSGTAIGFETKAGAGLYVVNQGETGMEVDNYADTDGQVFGGRFYVDANGHAVTNALALHVFSAATTGGSITNNYGLQIEDQTAGTNNWNIWSGPAAGAFVNTYGLLDGAFVGKNTFATMNSGSADGASIFSYLENTSTSGFTNGVYSQVFNANTSGTKTGIAPFFADIEQRGAGTLTNGNAFEGVVGAPVGVITNAAVFKADANYTGGGTITNNYGLLVDDQTAGTNNWNIYSGPAIGSFNPGLDTNWAGFGLYSTGNFFGSQDRETGAFFAAEQGNAGFVSGATFQAYGTTVNGGVYSFGSYDGSSPGGSVNGIYTVAGNEGSANLDVATGLYVDDSAFFSTDSITDNYGIHVADMTAGTNNWNIWSGPSEVDGYLAGYVSNDKNVFTRIDEPNKNTGGFYNQTATGNATALSGNSRLTGSAGSRYADGFYGEATSDSSGSGITLWGISSYVANTGSGTVSDASSLYVFGGGGGSTTNLYGLNIENQTGGTNNYSIYTNQSSGANNYALYNAGAGKSYFAGDVGIGNLTPSVALDITGSIEYTGTITDVSDQRLKDNIRDFSQSGLAIINSIGVKNYNMLETPDKTETGFIAQNVQQVFGEAVSIVDPEKGYMGVSYVSFIPVLTKAVQELDVKIDGLDTRLAAIEAANQSTGLLDSIFNKIKDLLADASNGISDIFAGTLHVTNQICIGQTCLNEAQLKTILENNGVANVSSGDDTSDSSDSSSGDSSGGTGSSDTTTTDGGGDVPDSGTTEPDTTTTDTTTLDSTTTSDGGASTNEPQPEATGDTGTETDTSSDSTTTTSDGSSTPSETGDSTVQ